MGINPVEVLSNTSACPGVERVLLGGGYNSCEDGAY
jgi:hypothetical protein